MAYIPVLSDILEVRAYVFDPVSPVQIGINVHHYRVTGISNGGCSQGQIAGTFDASLAALMKPLITDNVTYRGILVQKVWPKPVVTAEGSAANAGPGTGGATAMPTQVSPLIKKVTAKAGRAFRGRTYIPFPPMAAATAQGNMTAGYNITMQSLAAYLRGVITVTVVTVQTVLQPVIWHRNGYGQPPVNIGGNDDVTDTFAMTLFATQRRRGNYGRVNASSPI